MNLRSKMSLPPSKLQQLALLLANNCVRNNTVLEGYHLNGQLSNADMKRLNQDVANNVYTFLEYFLNGPKVDQLVFLATMFIHCPLNWDAPELNETWVQTVERFKQSEGRGMLISDENTDVVLEIVKALKKMPGRRG